MRYIGARISSKRKRNLGKKRGIDHGSMSSALTTIRMIESLRTKASQFIDKSDNLVSIGPGAEDTLDAHSL